MDLGAGAIPSIGPPAPRSMLDLGFVSISSRKIIIPFVL
ncbi:hypothetical protein ACP70R_013485 [Stipagrostis hirtigluma subsp. patula]